MEGVTQVQANQFYTATKFLQGAQKTCHDKCLVDFQQPDISAMEKECAKHCIRKHLSVFKDVITL